MKKLKILELTNFSAGICGVWQRVKQEAIELSRKGYEVKIFSSNATKGSNEIAKERDTLGSIQIIRFPFKKLGGESFMHWNFEEKALEYSPDIIIAHSYRHNHTAKALEIAKKLRSKGCPCRVFLVTHAPFTNIQRSFIQKISVRGYDLFIGRNLIKQFDKIIAITQWEIPFLEKLGVKKEKIVYIPNGIPEQFFASKPKRGKNILFLGRVSPVKNLEILIGAVKGLNLSLDILGPEEKEYRTKLDSLIKDKKIKNVRFLPAVFDIKKKINLIDSHEYLVLPSKSEAMPQTIIEAMARGKIVISSDTRGAKEIIQDKKNGFLFKRGSSKSLREIIENVQKISESQKSKISREAIVSSRRFRWKKLIEDLEDLF